MKKNHGLNLLHLSFALFFIVACEEPGQRAAAATYYVSQIYGNDANTSGMATNIATPWQTIQHAATNVAAGDTVVIRTGTYRETVTPSASGTSSAPITFQGYSNEIAVVSGTVQATNWVLESPNIYYCPTNLSLGGENQVFQNSLMVPLARWPNAGPGFPWQNSFTNPSPDWAYATSAGYNTNNNANNDGWISCSQLPGETNGFWDGATLHIMSGYGWVMAAPTVTGYTNATQTIVTTDANGGTAAYAFHAGNEFYLSGLKSELDSPGEWWYDSVNVRLYFYSGNTPTNVEAKARPVGFNLSGRPFIQISNLSFFACTILTDGGATNHLYSSLKMKYVMHSDYPFETTPSTTNRFVLQSGDVLQNSDIGFASDSLIYLAGSNIRVINNNLHDAGYIPDYYPLLSCNQAAQSNLIFDNTLHDSGRALLSYLSRDAIVEYNDFTNGMRLTTDGAPVYDVNDASAVLFDHNLVHDSPGPVGHLGNGVLGIYLDSKDSNWVLHHNIVWNIPAYCLCMNVLFEYDCVFNNTFANCGAGLTSNGSGAQGPDAGTVMYNNLFTGGLAGTSWSTADMRYNLYSNPGFIGNSYVLQTNSEAIDQGIPIPGITDGYIGSAPDLGALEVGADPWTNEVGWQATPPSPVPVYNYPNLLVANQVADGSFESGTLSAWSVVPGGSASINSANAWTTGTSRSGFYSLGFGTGTSQVGQTLTNLLPNSRYVYYAGINTMNNSTATITIGVTNYGNTARTLTIPITNEWVLYNLDFVTGSNSTSASIFINVVSPTTNKVYADDVGVMLKAETEQAQADPLAYYKLDETNGLTAYDSSGNGRNATLSNSPAYWTNGVMNGALYFNGTNALLTPAITTSTNGVTVACWAKSGTALWNAYDCFISERPGFVLGPYKNTTEIQFIINTNAGGAVLVVWYAPSTNFIAQWHHYAGVYSQQAQEATLYVDGIPVASASAATMYPSTGQIFIGKDDYTGDTYRNFNGTLDDVRIYNYAVSQAQIQAMATTNSGLTLHLALDDGTGSPIAWDSTGQGGNGTLSKMNTTTAWTNGILNGALSFNVTSNVVTTTPISTAGAFSISCWCKSATATWNASGCLVSKRPAFVLSPVQGTANMQFILYTNTTGFVTAVWTAPSGFDITQWHQYAGIFNPAANSATLYVDGFAVATAAAGGANATNAQIYLGQDSAGGANANLNGVIDDVQLYSRALAWNEVLDIADLTSDYPYDDGTPATPVNFTASAIGAGAIALTWTPGDTSQTGYELDYRAAGTTTWFVLDDAGASVTAYTNSSLQPLTAYDFRIEATNSAGDSGFALASITTPPAAPTVSGLTVTNTQIAIYWGAVSGATGYNVKSSTNNGGPYTVFAANMSNLSFTNTGLINCTPYFYVVSALNANGEGFNSAQVSGTPGALSRAGWVASASASQYNDQPSNAIDGYITTRWGSGTDQTNGMWFQVNMGAPQWFYQIVLENCGEPFDYPREYEVNVSNDGTNWGSPVATGAGEPYVTVIDFAPQTAQYIRVTSTTNYFGWWSIFEFNVFASLPSPWENEDIGNVNLAGSASYATNTFTVQGSGADIHGPADAFQYVFQSAGPVCSIVGKVESVENVNEWAKAGLMIRETTQPGAINVAMLVTPEEGINFQWRTNTGGTTYNTATATNLTAPYWVELTRSTNNFSAYYSPDGVTYTQLGSTLSFGMATSATLGMAVTAHNTNVLCTATFTNVIASP